MQPSSLFTVSVMMMRLCLMHLTMAFVVVINPSSSVVVVRRTTSSSSVVRTLSFRFFGVAGENGQDKDENNEKLDVETARSQLESILSKTSDKEDGNDDNSNNKGDNTDGSSYSKQRPPFSVRALLASLPFPDDDDLSSIDLPLPPSMSTMEWRRREHEIVLLEQLKKGNEVLSQLWELWYNERGPKMHAKLAEIDVVMGNPLRWDECEALLIRLIDGDSKDNDNNDDDDDDDAEGEGEGDHDVDRRPGIYFVEAVNRLATLYFLQGRLDDSYKLCRIVLQLKPWHFGALSGIVQVCIGRGDRDEARTWAERRLPTMVAGTSFPPFDTTDGPMNPRRAEWCDKAVANAHELLLLAEKNTQQSLGPPENYYLDPNETSGNGGEEGSAYGSDDAWQ